MNQALGLIEVKGLAAAINVSDVMVKSANVQVIGIEKAKGMGWMTVKVEGDVGAVKASVDAGKASAISTNSYVTSLVIPRPAQGLTDVFGKQAKEEEAPTPVKEEKPKAAAKPVAKAPAKPASKPAPKAAPKAEKATAKPAVKAQPVAKTEAKAPVKAPEPVKATPAKVETSQAKPEVKAPVKPVAPSTPEKATSTPPTAAPKKEEIPKPAEQKAPTPKKPLALERANDDRDTVLITN